MKGHGLLLWKVGDAEGEVTVDVESISLSSTEKAVIEALIKTLDDRPNEQTLGWYKVQVTIER